jgi:hypothetical protein
MRLKLLLVLATFMSLLPLLAYAQTPACQIANPPEGCADHMYFVRVEKMVAGTGIPFGGNDPNCGSANNDQALLSILTELAKRPDAEGLRMAAGDLFKWLGDSGIYRQLANNVSGAVHDVIIRNGPRASFSNCAMLSALIPSNASYKGYRISNTDIDASPSDPGRIGGCAPGQDCSNG